MVGRWAPLLLVAYLAASAAAELEVKTLKEGSDIPGVSGGSYAIVQDGRVVGLVEHYESEAPISRTVFGRRGGPVDDRPLPVGSFVDLITRHMDIFSLLQQQLLATRCPRARQAALARLQLASAAAAAAADGEAPGDSMPGFPGMMMFERVEEAEEAEALSQLHAELYSIGQAAGEEEAAMMPLIGRAATRHTRGPQQPLPAVDQFPDIEDMANFEVVQQKLFGAQEAAADAVAASAERLPRPARGVMPAWASTSADEEEGHWAPRHRLGGGVVHHDIKAPMGMLPEPDPLANHPTVLEMERLAGVEGPFPVVGQMFIGDDGHLYDLRDAAMPVPGRSPDMSWKLFDQDGKINWGLVAFVGLAVACVAVWGAMLSQYASYCSVRNRERAFFITRTEGEGVDALKPLLHEGPVSATDSAVLKKIAGAKLAGAGNGVECAAEHVPSTQRIVTVLHYEPLNSRA